jgi:alpha/beta superfamily hydrolase
MKRTHINFKSKDETLPATLYNDTAAVAVVLCPPHPLYGGSRNDTRIVKVAKELAFHDISALCIDYGSYGKGVKEIRNVLDAIKFIQKRVSCLGLLGYSFGAVVASNVAARAEIEGFAAISMLREVNGLKANLGFDCPKLFIHGKNDTVAPYLEFEYLYKEARGTKMKLILNTDHFYMENYPTMIDKASRKIRKFFQEQLSN